jgi:hypothetical protein
MPAALFPDGVVHTDTTWAGLLEQVRLLPWNRDLSPEEFRHAMAKRAWVWSESNVDPYLPPRQFVQALEMAGLLRIIRDRSHVEAIRAMLAKKKP